MKNYRDWGIPLGRRFRALKLWFLIREYGVSGLQARLRRDLDNASWLADQVDAEPGWERVAPVPLQTVCVLHLGDGDESAGDADERNLRIAEEVNAGGRYYLTSSLLKGRRIIRVSVGATPTERRDVEGVWRGLREAAARVEAAGS